VKRVILFAGHYGSGKTNLAVEQALRLARQGKKTLIADLDIVNPYFRTRDSEQDLEAQGVRIIVSPYANSNVDVPALPQEMYAIVDDKSYHAVVDVGGDDRGALALGRLAPMLREEDNYDMRFVVNFYRPLTQTAQQALNVMREVEAAGGLKFSAIVNNSNLGEHTDAQTILDTLERAEQLSRLSGLPLIGTGVREDLAESLKGKINNPIPLRLQRRSGWAIW